MRPGITQKVTVRGQGRTEIEPLNCIDPSSFYIDWEVNSTWSLQFTAYQDGSLAYSMLDSQASIFFDGQEYIIKQAEPDANSGQDSLDVVATHVYFELGRIRKYKTYVDPADANKQTDVRVNGSTQIENDNDDSDDTDPNAHKSTSTSKSGNTTTTTTVTKTDETKEDSEQENQVTYKMDDVLKYWIGGNKLGFTYQIIGNFPTARIEQLSDGSGMDMLSKITEHWPNAIIYPDNKNIRVYSQEKFNKDRNNRLDYEHNTTEFKWTFDSTNLTNEVMCIGGKYSIDTEVDIEADDSSHPSNVTRSAQGFIDDARSYLGVPYVYGGAGGARGGNPRSGMDCSSYVSQVYQDFGIHVPAQTVAMEPYFHEVSSPQTGDVGFYGAHGNSYHICMFLDPNTIIFEPQPGQVCKEEPANWFYPSWVARNDQMAAIVSSDAGGSGGSTSSSSSKTVEYYYFAPFMYRDENSIKKYGEYPAEPIEDGRFRDKNAMTEYAKTKIQPNPALSVEVTTYTHFKPIAGDMIHIMVKSQQISTNEAVVGFNWYPFSSSNPTSVTLNSNTQNILDYQNARNKSLMNAINAIKNQSNYIQPNNPESILTITREEAQKIEQYVDRQNSQQKPSKEGER